MTICIKDSFLIKFSRLTLQEEFNDHDFEHIQRFVILLYDRSSSCTKVNICRRILFTSKNKDIELIPPTEDALKQHLLRAMLQAM